MTLSFNFRCAIVTTRTRRKKNHGPGSFGSKIEWRQTNRQTDGETRPIALPAPLMRSVTKIGLVVCNSAVYLADEKIMIAIATVVRAPATTPLSISTASSVFSPPMPKHTHYYNSTFPLYNRHFYRIVLFCIIV